MPGDVFIWVLFGICLVLSFVLSGMEAGVFALSRLRIRQQMRAGRPSARVLYRYLENPENFLWTILVGNTLANFIILGWLVVVLQTWFPNRYLFVLVYAVAVFLFYACFDLFAKMLFRTFPNRLCLGLARPFRLVHTVLRPLVSLVEWFSERLLRWHGGKAFTGHVFGNREELRLVMQESAQAFSSEERAMINRVLDLQTLTVRQIMTPIARAVTATTKTTVAEALDLVRERRLSLLPVWEISGNERRVIGLVSLSSLLYQPDLNPETPLLGFVTPALFLDEDARLEVALRRMQRAGQRLAIVLNPGRQEVGLLSLQDILKMVFGEVTL